MAWENPEAGCCIWPGSRVCSGSCRVAPRNLFDQLEAFRHIVIALAAQTPHPLTELGIREPSDGCSMGEQDRLDCGGEDRRSVADNHVGMASVFELGSDSRGPDVRASNLLGFLTDTDLPAARIAHQQRCLKETAARAREITAVLAESQFAPAAGGFIAAHSSVLVPCAGDRWLAVGDASMSSIRWRRRGCCTHCSLDLPRPKPWTVTSQVVATQ